MGVQVTAPSGIINGVGYTVVQPDEVPIVTYAENGSVVMVPGRAQEIMSPGTAGALCTRILTAADEADAKQEARIADLAATIIQAHAGLSHLGPKLARTAIKWFDEQPA